MPLDPQDFTFEDLAVWRTQLPDVDFAILPPGDTRPNPVVSDDMLFVSIFSPGAVCALDRQNGHVIWRKEITNFAGSSVSVRDGTLLAKSSHTLYALDRDSGATLWSFSPYGPEGESIYSSPTVHQGRVHIGDRRGFLHCLDLNTGEAIWKELTNESQNHDVNSTPLISGELVIVATNANCVVAYEAAMGRQAWKEQVDGPSILGPVLFGDSVVVAAESLYLLNPENGVAHRHFEWKRKRPNFVECTSDMVLVALRKDGPPNGELGLEFVNRSGIQHSATLFGYCAHFRFCHEKKLLYVSGLRGLDICDPATAECVYRIASDDDRGGAGLVDVKKETIYALTGSGCVYALRHPSAGRAP